jgi:single-stranded-DNA-specific exonuclease
VIGIVASRLKDRVHRPTFVFALGRDGMLKGSGRSIAAFICAMRSTSSRSATRRAEALRRPRDGRGCTIDEADFDTFDGALQLVAREALDAATLDRVVRSDGSLAIEYFSVDTVRAMDAQVWGQAFEAPLFCDEVEVTSQRLVGEST